MKEKKKDFRELKVVVEEYNETKRELEQIEKDNGCRQGVYDEYHRDLLEKEYHLIKEIKEKSNNQLLRNIVLDERDM